MPPLILSGDSLARPEEHMFSDAAMVEGTARAVIGGFYRDAKGKAHAFSQAVDMSNWDTGVKDFVPHIGHYEMLAAVVAAKVFPTLMSGKRLTHHIDNVGDVYQIIDGFSRDLVLQSLIDEYWDSMINRSFSAFLAFTSTKLNIADYLTRDDLIRRFIVAAPGTKFLEVGHLLVPAGWGLVFNKYQKFLGHHIIAEIFTRNKKTKEKRKKGKLSAGAKRRKLGLKW